MARVLLKRCVRCGGDLFYDRDSWGSYYNCVQCGWQVDEPFITRGMAIASRSLFAPALLPVTCPTARPLSLASSRRRQRP